MNIVYTINDAFAPQVSASIASVCENNPDADEINFYIFGDGLSSTVRKNLSSVAHASSRNLYVVDIAGYTDAFDGFDTKGWNEIVLARLMVGRYLPIDLHRVLYLDGDTIAVGSLRDLWETPLDDCVIGAAIEATVDRKRIMELGIAGRPYFNAGVLLIDLDKWRSMDAEKAVIECCKQRKDELFANDQDAINISLGSKIKPISLAYNYCNSYEFYPYKTLLRLSQGTYFYSKEQFADAVAHPKIIHFLGEERPWRAGSTHTFTGAYKKYLALTPYKDTPDELGWQAYFKIWSCFNSVTKHMPMIRYRLISNLIPVFMRYRTLHKSK